MVALKKAVFGFEKNHLMALIKAVGIEKSHFILPENRKTKITICILNALKTIMALIEAVGFQKSHFVSPENW